MLSGWKNVGVSYHVSSTAAAGGSGNKINDSVAAYVALSTYDDQQSPTFGGTADITVKGARQRRNVGI